MKCHILILGAICLLTAAALAADPPPEPKVGNRPLSAWVADLDDKDTLIREEAIEVLIQLGAEAKAALPKLEKLAQNDSPAVRIRAAMALWKIGVQAEPARTILRAAMSDPANPKRIQAALFLQQMGAKAQELAPVFIDTPFPKQPRPTWFWTSSMALPIGP